MKKSLELTKRSKMITNQDSFGYYKYGQAELQIRTVLWIKNWGKRTTNGASITSVS